MVGRMAMGMLLVVGQCGCATEDRLVATQIKPEVDGMLDEAVWAQAAVHPLVQPQDQTDDGQTLFENGTCRYFRVKKTLYLAVEFNDSWIITTGNRDGDDLYHGDCCEVFIKPIGQPFYWEIWISPSSLRSVVKWRKKNDLESKGHFLDQREIQVATTVNGTLNDGEADDNGWILEAALPLPDVPGVELGAWEILIARQNYDGTLSKNSRELSSFPKLSVTDFHLVGEYMKLNGEEKHSVKGACESN